MSTYNGKDYLEEQIASIALQQGLVIKLIIRDDGSTDGTPDLVQQLLPKYCSEDVSISISRGENKGFLGSFEELLLNAADCDFYAFADQDDVWEPVKLARAAALLQKADAQPALYASSVVITDESLHPIACNAFPGLEYSIGAELIRHRLAGHTMLWNEALQTRVRAYGSLHAWSHDQHVMLVGLLVGAPLYMDAASYVKHRRRDSSITPGNGSFMKRVAHEWKLVSNKGNQFDRKALAAAILETSNRLDSDEIRLLRLIMRGTRSDLLRSRALRCGLLAGDIEAKISILIGRF